MTETWGETLSRLIDGDEVDPLALSAALDSPEGRRLLVQLASVRVVVRSDRAVPSRDFADGVKRELERWSVAPRSVGTRLPFRVAAALILAALLGFGANTWRHRRADLPPYPARVLKFEASEWTNTAGGKL